MKNAMVDTTPTSSLFVFTTEDGCWTSETCIANLKLCVSTSSFFVSAISSSLKKLIRVIFYSSQKQLHYLSFLGGCSTTENEHAKFNRNGN